MLLARPNKPEPLGPLAALVPVVALIGLLGLSFFLFGEAAAGGANQIALVFCSVIAIYVAWHHGYSVGELRDAAVASVNTGLPAIFILLAVGSLIGTWALSGTLIAMVYYGLKLLSPDYFYMTACLICAVIALSIGSSWTVAGTIGIGLMGIAEKMGLDPAITAGAVISGAYFGDKSSPLSDTANLACAAAGANLYEHVRESLWTSMPSLVIALVLFWSLGSAGDFDASAVAARIDGAFHPSPVHFLPLVLVLVLALLRWPPFVTVFLGALAGGLLAVVVAPERVVALAGPDHSVGLLLLKGVWTALATGNVSATGELAVDQLLSRGGMESMLGTVWLILVALAFGGIVEKAGVLERLIGPVIAAARSIGSLVTTLVGAAFATNVLASDQYIAVVLPGRMFRSAFQERDLGPAVLSRALGDSATVTSPLIPWNSCGAYMAATLGVATITYIPFCFFSLLNPLVTIAFAFLGIRMLPIRAKETPVA
ncbi:MAG TPA: Na+/H+ antiporter NhaC family protein [Rhizobiaceae bacterium]|nr:Na+/H+ antiporter NhaC family protein [Rhizobiaceae bacterium]